VKATVIAAVATVTVLGIVNHRQCGDALNRTGSKCMDASTEEQWSEASIACAREAEETGDAAFGVRGARALLSIASDNSGVDKALRSAERWFGSNEDATARQVAGAAYDKRDDSAQAIPLLQGALAAHVKSSNHEEAARDEGYLAAAFLHEGLLGDAFDAAEAAVRESDLTSSGNMHTRLRGKMRLKLGKILFEIGDLSTAQKTLWDAQQALAAWPVDQAWVFLQLGMLHQANDDYPSAAILLERVLEIASKLDVAQRVNVAQVATAARLNLAYVKRELGDLDGAELQMHQLDESTRARTTALFVEGLLAADRGHREVAEQLLAQAADHAPTDDYAIDIAVERGRIAERGSNMTAAEQYYRAAIALVEKLRSNTNSLKWRTWVLTRRRDPYRRLLALLARQDRRVEALDVAEQLHGRVWLDALVGRTETLGLRKQVPFARSLEQQLRGHATRVPSSDELLALLRGREALVFSELESDIWRFHIVDGTIIRLDRIPDLTRSLIEGWRKALNDHALADKLGSLLIPPAARARSQRPLYIVTNGALDTLPFAALRPEGRFFIEDRVISRLPGLVALRCRPHRSALESSVFLGDSRDNLPAARTETTAISSMLGGTAFVGQDATVERFEASRDAVLLHLAVHAEVDDVGARLLFANHKQVTIADIVEHEIGPRLTVLAGCATAVAGDAEGWGSLSSAFLAAGSRSVVGTLQSVVDSDARDIMRRFYSLGGDRQPAIALAKVQRELLAADPSAWALFTVYGTVDMDDCETTP